MGDEIHYVTQQNVLNITVPCKLYMTSRAGKLKRIWGLFSLLWAEDCFRLGLAGRYSVLLITFHCVIWYFSYAALSKILANEAANGAKSNGKAIFGGGLRNEDVKK